MKQKRRDKIFLTLMLTVFILLNYTIISFGQTLTSDAETNNCTHMSSRLENIFERVGIPVTLQTGGCSDGSRHMWIRLWGIFDVDSETLTPMFNTKYHKYMINYDDFDDYKGGSMKFGRMNVT